MPSIIRSATPIDRDAIAQVFLACWNHNYSAVLPARLVAGMNEARATQLWERVLTEAHPGEVLVAVKDGENGSQVLGVTRFARMVDGTGVVHSLYVSPPSQGSGLGSRLLTAAANALGNAGCHTATLWVFRGNLPSIAFYARQGWLADGGERVQAEFGEPEIRLRKDLTRSGSLTARSGGRRDAR